MLDSEQRERNCAWSVGGKCVGLVVVLQRNVWDSWKVDVLLVHQAAISGVRSDATVMTVIGEAKMACTFHALNVPRRKETCLPRECFGFMSVCIFGVETQCARRSALCLRILVIIAAYERDNLRWDIDPRTLLTKV